jgi:hypothetical protein
LSSAGRAAPTASAEKNYWDFVHALRELAIWLQAGEDRAIAGGGQPSGFKKWLSSPTRAEGVLGVLRPPRSGNYVSLCCLAAMLPRSAARGYQSTYLVIPAHIRSKGKPRSSSPTRQLRAGVASRAERTHVRSDGMPPKSPSAHCCAATQGGGTNARCPVANCRTARPGQRGKHNAQCPSCLTASQQNRRHKLSQTSSQLGRTRTKKAHLFPVGERGAASR